MALIDDVLTQAEAAAKANTDAEDAAITLLQTLSQMVANLQAGGTDPATIARIQALSAALNAKASALGAAIVTDTPAAPPPVGGANPATPGATAPVTPVVVPPAEPAKTA